MKMTSSCWLIKKERRSFHPDIPYGSLWRSRQQPSISSSALRKKLETRKIRRARKIVLNSRRRRRREPKGGRSGRSHLLEEVRGGIGIGIVIPATTGGMMIGGVMTGVMTGVTVGVTTGAVKLVPIDRTSTLVLRVVTQRHAVPMH